MELDIKWTNLERVLNEFADEVITTARGNLDTNNTNASHYLYDSLDKIVKVPDADGNDSYFSVSISLADYWRYVEEGTGPGHVPDARGTYWPKIQPLKDWVSNKPGVPKDDAFAYAVRGKIHASGTTAQPFFQPAVDEALARFEIRIEEAIEQDIYDYINGLVSKGLEDALT